MPSPPPLARRRQPPRPRVRFALDTLDQDWGLGTFGHDSGFLPATKLLTAIPGSSSAMMSVVKPGRARHIPFQCPTVVSNRSGNGMTGVLSRGPRAAAKALRRVGEASSVPGLGWAGLGTSCLGQSHTPKDGVHVPCYRTTHPPRRSHTPPTSVLPISLPILFHESVRSTKHLMRRQAHGPCY